MRSSTLFSGLVAAIASLSAAQAASLGLSIFEKLAAVPEGWVQDGTPSPNSPMRFRIALKQPNAGAFEQAVIDMSTPGHATYGKHMKRDQIKDILRPSDDAIAGVMSWLLSSGIDEHHIKEDGDWIVFRASVSEAEALLSTKFYNYHNTYANMHAIRTLQYSLPEDLHDYVQMVQPTIRFGQMRPQRSTIKKTEVLNSAAEIAEIVGPFNATSCNTTLTPTCLRELYNVGNYTADPTLPNKLGIAGYLMEYARYADFEAFKARYAPFMGDYTFDYVTVNNGSLGQNSSSDSIEANLDVQYAFSVGYNTPGTFYSTGGLGPLVPDLDQEDQPGNNEPYVEFLSYLVSLPDDELPTVLSSSYGEDEQSVPESWSNATCSLYAQLGARGVSVLHSSGDEGVGGNCQTNDGRNATRFNPAFPAACPFVTAVGGTYHVEPEAAVDFSGGGFSDRFARPAYQEEAVTGFLDALGDRFEGLFNAYGRGYPDVAAQGRGFPVFDKGSVVAVGGTRSVVLFSPPTVFIMYDLSLTVPKCILPHLCWRNCSRQLRPSERRPPGHGLSQPLDLQCRLQRPY